MAERVFQAMRVCTRIGLEELDDYIGRMLAGRVTGRILIELDRG